MKNSSQKPVSRYARMDIKKIDKDTYQEEDKTTGGVINYKKNHSGVQILVE